MTYYLAIRSDGVNNVDVVVVTLIYYYLLLRCMSLFERLGKEYMPNNCPWIPFDSDQNCRYPTPVIIRDLTKIAHHRHKSTSNSPRFRFRCEGVIKTSQEKHNRIIWHPIMMITMHFSCDNENKINYWLQTKFIQAEKQHYDQVQEYKATSLAMITINILDQDQD